MLATSFPTDHSIGAIRDLVLEDARSGADRFGLAAMLDDSCLTVAYPMAATAWTV